MASVILQPCASSLAIQHFYTITEGVSLSSIKAFVDARTLEKLRSFYPDSKVSVWGIEEKTGINKIKWQRIRPGDITYFYRNRTLVAYGKVTMTLKNEQLATHLWGRNAKGATWKYIYFLRDLKETEIPIDGLNGVLDRKPDQHIQLFTVLDEEISQLVLQYFGFLVPRPEKPQGTNRTNPDVVMPLCKLGCDHLYEYGYLPVSGGKVVTLRTKPLTPFIRSYVAKVKGKNCRYYGENNRIFFQDHYDFNAGQK